MREEQKAEIARIKAQAKEQAKEHAARTKAQTKLTQLALKFQSKLSGVAAELKRDLTDKAVTQVPAFATDPADASRRQIDKV